MVEQFKEEAKKIHISAVIYVERDSQKGIIIGKQGKALKKDLMDLPVVFAKKKSPKTIQNALSTTVHSFTKDRDYEVVISADFLTPNDNVLFVDDFLAYGNAALGIIDLIKQSGANLVGMGFIIEKAFQNGRKKLEEQSVRVESLAIIEDLSNCCIKIKDE